MGKEIRWETLSAEERFEKSREMCQGMDWDAYDYTTAPGADMSFPDLTEEQCKAKPVWLSKHYNDIPSNETCHIADLNAFTDGKERRLFALYGLPVCWPARDERDELNELIGKLDDARAEGGETWTEAMGEHGVVNDEHYVWLRGYKLGMPPAVSQNYDVAKEVVVLIDTELANGNEEILSDYDFRDRLHYEYFKGYIARAREQAWARFAVVREETFSFLNDRFLKNKEALSGELAPFQGVSLETWAGACARLAQNQPIEAVLQQLGMERPRWDEVNGEWMARMSRDTTATIATVYGQAFMGAGQGQFGAAGQAVSGSMAAGFGSQVQGGAPTLSFEDWIKIQEHVSAGTAQGIDPAAILAQYKLTAADFGTVGGYWGMKLSTDMALLEKYQVLSAKFREQFATAKAGSDIEF
jgi:hypothetical protein